MALQSLRNSHWLRAGVFSTLLIGSLILWLPGWCRQSFPEFPFKTVALATVQHSELALQLTQSMVTVHEAGNTLAESISAARLEAFADLTNPHSETVSNGLLSISRVATKVSHNGGRSFAYLAGTLHRLSKRFTSIASSLEIFWITRGNAPKGSLKSLYSWYIARDLPEHLASIESWLDESRDQCEIATWSRGNVVPELEALRRPLGLIRPWWFLWWRARAWDHSAEVQWRQMLFSMTYDVYNLMNQYCEAIERAHRDTSTYASREGIFKPVDLLMPVEGQSEGRSTEESLSLLTENLEKIRFLIRKVQDEHGL